MLCKDEVRRISGLILDEELGFNTKPSVLDDSSSKHSFHKERNSNSYDSPKSGKLTQTEYCEFIGPKHGQVTCGIMTNTEKKDIFAIQYGPEEEREWMANYGITVESNGRNDESKKSEGFPCIETKAVSPKDELKNSEKSISPLLSPLHKTQNIENTHYKENFNDFFSIYEFDTNYRDIVLQEIQPAYADEIFNMHDEHEGMFV